MSKGHNPVAIATYFIELDIKKGGRGLDIMQLLKLSYIAHGFHLGDCSSPLCNESVEAWQYGPVFPSIFNEFKSSDDASKKIKHTPTNTPSPNFFEEYKKMIMDSVYKIYGHYNGWELSKLTHKEGSPWYQIWHEKGGSEGLGAIIPDSIIEEYFKENIIKKYFS